MRRGQPGIGGWRSENQRHFRPRGNGPPRFRPPRMYPLLESPRFPPPSPRLNQRGPPPFNAHGGHPDDHDRQDHHDRHREYRDSHRQIDQRMPERAHHPRSRPMYQYVHSNMRSKDNQCSSYKEKSNFYEDITSEPFHVNNMGDIDQRQLPLLAHPSDSYSQPQQQISPWANPPPGFKKHDYDDRCQNSYRHHDIVEKNKIPAVDYTGHRPPASDHYGGTSGPTTNNNDTSFSRSVDDTVDIIRKRLMNRNDPERLSQDAAVHQSITEQEGTENANQHIQPEQPAKKRTPRQRHNVKSNCDKMKSNIVHQLFKMDKDKMHKLMDDPGSSSKFEYAISSLITESQNSLNRHLRSVAEKSLYSSSTDFIHNDNNTIYEDTFMKQMQCLLDPQDTVLLEDIKPIVMAELSKVLQLAEFEQRFDVSDEHSGHHTADGQPNYPYFEPYNYDEYSQDPCFEQDQPPSINYENLSRLNLIDNSNKNLNYNHEAPYEEVKPLFERRKSKRIDPVQERELSVESQRRSLETPVEEPFKGKEEPLPLFDGNTDQLSEDEDTFAELDRQYHVAVDHNFIENDDLSRQSPKFEQVQQAAPHIGNEIDCQLQTMAQSPLDLFPVSSTESLRDTAKHIMQEVTCLGFRNENTHENTPKTSDNGVDKVKQIKIKQEHVPQPKDTEKETEKAGSSNIIKTPPSNSRKRSIDQRPSHRKEKRKKSESSQSDSGKPTSEKNIPNNAGSIKSTEKCNDAPKPYYNIFINKNESTKETKDCKKVDSTDKSYSDKYVKRKETLKKPKEKESESGRKRHSSTSSQTILSPKDTNSQTPTKSDSKIKLKTFDMFVEQPKKSSSHHHAHRNTALAISPTKPIVEENILKQVPTPTPARNKTVQTKHVGTQVIRRLITKETQTIQNKNTSTRFCQTERKKLVSKCVQTLAISFESSKPRSADAFERMKEIDMEIQVLLQEKFKLYSSLESKDTCPSSMPTLGMTVLNVTPIDESKDEGEDDTESLHDNIMNADEIVDDFTSIPVEELEQIALESVQEDSTDSTKVEKRSLRPKVLQQERNNSESPTSSKRSNKKTKPPNISLLEQIITDDRPLEDIISLDDLEEPPAKTKKKPRSQPKKKPTKRTKPQKNANSFDLKDCSVVLIQTDVRKFIKEESIEADETSVPVETEPSNTGVEEVVPLELEAKPAPRPRQVEEETVVNDLQFDMLDVSEDIVIGEESEIKCNDKDMHGREAISEEIILDNSQSSADDASTAESGQAENECKMYDYSTDEKLRRDSVTVTGNADAVLAIECIETDFIAACLDGNVYHFSGDGQLLNTLRGSNLAVTCLTIVKEKYGTTVYTGSLDSRIRYYDLETGLEKGPECNVLSPIQTMDRAWDTVFVGTRTGFVLQFECKNNMLIPVSTVKFSEQSILALRAMKEGPRKVLLVAARSENVTIKDAQTGLLLRTLSGPKMTVYTLLFEDGKVFCGTSSHQIHVFEYASGSHTGCHEGGKGAVCLRATGGLLFAGCYDGCVYVYREGETRPLAQLRGPSLMLLSLAVVGSKIIAGYKDRSLYIWKIPLSILQEMIL